MKHSFLLAVLLVLLASCEHPTESRPSFNSDYRVLLWSPDGSKLLSIRQSNQGSGGNLAIMLFDTLGKQTSTATLPGYLDYDSPPYITADNQSLLGISGMTALSKYSLVDQQEVALIPNQEFLGASRNGQRILSTPQDNSYPSLPFKTINLYDWHSGNPVLIDSLRSDLFDFNYGYRTVRATMMDDSTWSTFIFDSSNVSRISIMDQGNRLLWQLPPFGTSALSVSHLSSSKDFIVVGSGRVIKYNLLRRDSDVYSNWSRIYQADLSSDGKVIAVNYGTTLAIVNTATHAQKEIAQIAAFALSPQSTRLAYYDVTDSTVHVIPVVAP